MQEAIDLNSLISSRVSSRNFSKRKVDSSIIELLIQAAQSTPSSRNTQPWQFLISEKGSNSFGLILDTLTPSNQNWSNNAPLFIVAIANRANNYKHLEYDLGQSVAFLTIQATELGLNLRQMAGFNSEMLNRKLSLGDNLDAFTVIAIGYKSDDEMGSNTIAKRDRKPVEEICKII
jgi:hypothetical protein